MIFYFACFSARMFLKAMCSFFIIEREENIKRYQTILTVFSWKNVQKLIKCTETENEVLFGFDVEENERRKRI